MAEIVKVVRDGGKGYHFINKQDFDPKKHVLFEEKEATKSVDKRTATQQAQDK